MHRIDTPTAQKDKFGAGKNGFTAGNPQTGTPATDLDNDYFDMLQEELAGVVEATGVNLDKSKHNQLLTALKALLLSRAHPFADIKADGPAAIAEALANLDLVNNGVVGRLIGVQVITSTQTYTETPGTKFRRVQIVGAGGGGGGCPSTGASQQSTARGGQCGAYLDVVIYGSLSPISVTIGSKGTGGTSAPTPGTDGGTSSFGNLISCPGGIGGNAGAVASSTSNIIGDSPIGNSPTLNFGTTQYKIILTKPCLYGAMRQMSIGALIGQVCGGDGGDSPLGASGHGGSGMAGIDATGHGAGGGGSSQIQYNNGDKGGDGASGVCIIWEYA